MSNYKFQYEASPHKKYKGIFKEAEGDKEDTGPASNVLPYLQKDLIRYMVKSGVPSARANLAANDIITLLNNLSKDKYSSSTARLFARYLDKFYSQIG